jgi:hypothetical protein
MDETKVRVRLDTRQAKTEMRTLSKEGSRTAGQLSTNLRSTVRRGMGLVGAGAIVGAGMSALRSPTSSGISDVISEAFGGLGLALSDKILGKEGVADALASRSAREATKEAFAYAQGAYEQAGGEGLLQGASTYFEAIRPFRKTEELGRRSIESNPALRGGLPWEKILDDLEQRLKNALFSGVDRLLGGLGGIGFIG